ncbi:MAG: sulfatase-like hydrolase/transferase [Thermomicrobiales bacterium]
MKTRRPNILLIMADQLPPRVLGAYGGPVPTPGLDRLCETGVVFDQATTPFPVCSPARASLVTGMHPHAHGIVHNVMSQDYSAVASSPHDRGISASDQTTEGLLHASGYQTYHRGKWHLSDEPLPYYADWYREMQEYGFELRPDFDAAAASPQSMNWYGWTLPVDVSPLVLERFFGAGNSKNEDNASSAYRRFDEFIGKMGRLLWPEEMTYDHRVTTKAIQCIEQAVASDQPFTVTCSLNNPHDPNVVPDPYYHMFDPDEISLPASFGFCEERHRDSLSWQLATRLGEAGVREFLRIHYAQVAMTDAQIERLLATLDRCGIANDTLVLFVGDHGDMVGGHGMIWKSTEAFYDELVRVPLVMRWPGWLTPGRDSRCVSLVDVMPTLLEAAGVGEYDPVHGQSLLGSTSADWPSYAVTQRFVGHDSTSRHVSSEDRMSIMIRTPTHKFVRYHDGAEEFYDLASDAGELVNLASNRGGAGERHLLLSQLTGWMRQTAHPHHDLFARLLEPEFPSRSSGR